MHETLNYKIYTKDLQNDSLILQNVILQVLRKDSFLDIFILRSWDILYLNVTCTSVRNSIAFHISIFRRRWRVWNRNVERFTYFDLIYLGSETLKRVRNRKSEDIWRLGNVKLWNPVICCGCECGICQSLQTNFLP